MDFTLSEDDQELVNLIDRIGAEQFAPKAFARRNQDGHPIDNMRLLGQLGILGICLPAELGGEGRDALSGILAIEHIARWCPRTGISASMAIAGPGMFIAKWGTPEQKAKYIPKIRAGEANMSIALTEPQAGSALTDLATRAEIKNGTCRLNGQKTFCSHAGWDDQILVFCRFGPATADIGAVIVDRGTPGFTLSQPHYHMSGTPWWELFFDHAEVPEENVLFASDGFRKLMSSYSLERCAAGASSIGIAQAAFELARDYAVERKQFGRPICDFQFIQDKLANMYLALEQARLLLYKAVKGGHGKRGTAGIFRGEGRSDGGRGFGLRSRDADFRRRGNVPGNAAGVDVSGGADRHGGRRNLRDSSRHDRQRTRGPALRAPPQRGRAVKTFLTHRSR